MLFSGRTNTDFWFTAPELASGHSDQPIFIHLTSFNQSANVTISEPANTVNFPTWLERYQRQRIKIFINTGQRFTSLQCLKRLQFVDHEIYVILFPYYDDINQNS
jgi:hypothetical protein